MEIAMKIADVENMELFEEICLNDIFCDAPACPIHGDQDPWECPSDER
jgi:hypothetical protein